MKKFLSVVLAVMMILTIAACGKKEEAPVAATNEPTTTENGFRKTPDTYLSIATGGAGGGWYIMGALFNDKWESNIPGLKMTLLPGGGSSNPDTIDDGEDAQIGFTYISNANAAKNGTGAYAEKHDNMYALCNLSVKQYLTLCVDAKYKYDTIADIVANKAKIKWAVGPRAGGNEVALEAALKEYGTSYEEMTAWGASIQYISTNDGCSAMKDGQIDANANLTAPPLAALTEMLTTKDCKFLSIDEKEGKAAAAKYGYTYEMHPANIYPNQTEEFPTLVDTVVLVVNKDKITNDMAYNLAKTLYENKEAWVSGYAALAPFDPANCANTGIELHPGAAEFYKEVGLIK